MAEDTPLKKHICALRGKTLLGLLAGILMFLTAGAAQAASNPRYASIVMDADTGMILHESNADKSLHPASLVKMMTMMMVFDALEQGRLRLRDNVVISNHAASMVPSKLDLSPGSSIKVEDALYALATKSANDIAVALAEKLGGTEGHFAIMMNRKAREIGMRSTYFRNASGLHDPKQVSTARDMAKLARYILYEYPQYYHYFSTQKFTYRGNTYRNHNRLMESYKGMDGFKTGYIQASGFNLVASAKRNNKRLIGVVFGGQSSQSRNAHMATLLDRGFGKINEILVASAAPLKTPLPPRKPVEYIAVAALNSVEAASGSGTPATLAGNQPYKQDLERLLQGRAFTSMIGEGDFDPAVSKRFETGLVAIAAVRENGIRALSRKAQDRSPAANASLPPAGTEKGQWAIQIGAFHSRAQTDKAIQEALAALPPAHRQKAVATIVPLRTENGWLFRGRLNGYYNRESAIEACSYLNECLPVSPAAY